MNFALCARKLLPKIRECIRYSTYQSPVSKSFLRFQCTLLLNNMKFFQRIIKFSAYSTAKNFVPKPHSMNIIDIKALNDKLNECHSVVDQINTLHSCVKLSKEDVAFRHAITRDLADLLKPHYPGSKVDLIGSSVTGLGRKGCDVDLSFTFDGSVQSEPSDSKYLTKDILSGKVPSSVMPSLSQKQQLVFIQRVLKESSLVEKMCVVPGRCPILSFRYKKLCCDLSISNVSALQATNFVRFCTNLDARVEPLFHVISYNFSHIIGGIEKFKSYAFFLMLVYFLQTCKPSILPTVADMLAKTDFLETFCDVSLILKHFEQSKNTQPLDVLLKEFHFFYLNFDFSFVIDTLRGQAVEQAKFTSFYCSNPKNTGEEKFLFNAISIQDPLRKNWNLATEVSFKNSKLFIRQLLNVCDLYQTPQCPPQQHWGLSSILNGKFSHNNFTKSQIVITLPLEPVSQSEIKRAFEAVYKTFAYCLLFECQKLDGVSSVSSSQPVLSKRARMLRKNRFQARDNVVSKLNEVEMSDRNISVSLDATSVSNESSDNASLKSTPNGVQNISSDNVYFEVKSNTVSSNLLGSVSSKPTLHDASEEISSDNGSQQTALNSVSNDHIPTISNSISKPQQTSSNLKFKFIATDTWLGRTSFDTNFETSFSNFADKEHEISLKMLELRTKVKEKAEFLCECETLLEHEKTRLVVIIKPLNCDVLSPKMAVILADYVEKCVKRIVVEEKN